MIREVQNDTAKAVEAMKRGTSETSEGMSHVGLTGKAFKEILEITNQFLGSMDELSERMEESQKGDTMIAAKAVDGIASICRGDRLCQRGIGRVHGRTDSQHGGPYRQGTVLVGDGTNMQRSVSQVRWMNNKGETVVLERSCTTQRRLL